MRQYDKVKVKNNDYAKDGITIGMEGYIIEVYPDGNFEVEFSRSDTGETLAMLALTPNDIESAE